MFIGCSEGTVKSAVKYYKSIGYTGGFSLAVDDTKLKAKLRIAQQEKKSYLIGNVGAPKEVTSPEDILDHLDLPLADKVSTTIFFFESLLLLTKILFLGSSLCFYRKSSRYQTYPDCCSRTIVKYRRFTTFSDDVGSTRSLGKV